MKLAKLKADLAQAQSAVGTEASQKTQIIKEAESAIQRQRSEIINQAEQTMQHQGALVKKQFPELTEEVRTAEQTLELERTIRIQAQGDLQRVAQQLYEEGIRDIALGDQKRVLEDLLSEKAAQGRTQQELQAAYQEGRILVAKTEKQDQQLLALKNENLSLKNQVTRLTADVMTGSSQNFQQQMEQQSRHREASEERDRKIQDLTAQVQDLSSQNQSLRSQNTALKNIFWILRNQLR